MSLTIVATAGSASANSFVTEAEAITYAATRLNASAWTTASGTTCTESEKKALIEATRELTVLDWEGTRVDTTQALSWPREFAIDPDKPSAAVLGDISLLYFDTTEIPQRVKDATCELAFQFLKAGTTDLASLDSAFGVVRKRVDVLETEWNPSVSRPTGLARFPRIVSLIQPLLSESGQGGGLEISRV